MDSELIPQKHDIYLKKRAVFCLLFAGVQAYNKIAGFTEETRRKKVNLWQKAD